MVSFIPPESRHFTYALSMPLWSIPELALRLRSTDLAVDAVEIVVELDGLLPYGQTFSDVVATRLTKDYYNLRRNVRLPVILHVAIPGSGSPSDVPQFCGDSLWSTYLKVVSHALRLGRYAECAAYSQRGQDFAEAGVEGITRELQHPRRGTNA